MFLLRVRTLLKIHRTYGTCEKAGFFTTTTRFESAKAIRVLLKKLTEGDFPQCFEIKNIDFEDTG